MGNSETVPCSACGRDVAPIRGRYQRGFPAVHNCPHGARCTGGGPAVPCLACAVDRARLAPAWPWPVPDTRIDTPADGDVLRRRNGFAASLVVIRDGICVGWTPVDPGPVDPSRFAPPSPPWSRHEAVVGDGRWHDLRHGVRREVARG